MPTDKSELQGALTHQQIISIATQLSATYPIVCRDISSANVLFKPMGHNQWEAKVSDYAATSTSSARYQLWDLAIPLHVQPSSSSPTTHVSSLPKWVCSALASFSWRWPQGSCRLQRIILVSYRPFGAGVGLHQLIEACIRDDPSHRPSMQNALVLYHACLYSAWIADS